MSGPPVAFDPGRPSGPAAAGPASGDVGGPTEREAEERLELARAAVQAAQESYAWALDSYRDAEVALAQVRTQVYRREVERAALASTGPPAGAVAHQPPPPPPSGPEGPGALSPVPSRAASVPASVVLLVVGAVLLLSAAAVFVALSWRDLGVVGQALVLGAATLAAAGVTVVLWRARLRAGTEALATVTAGLTVLDLVGARAFDLFGLGAVGVALYVTVAATGLAGVATAVVALTVRGGRGVVAALVTACACVPVAAVAGAVAVGDAVLSGPVPVGDGVVAGVVAGALEGVTVVGLVALALARPASRVPGGGALRQTLVVSGLVGLGVAAALLLIGAALLPLVLTGPAALPGTVPLLLRLGGGAVLALLLALLPTRGRTRGRRAVAAAVGAVVVLLAVSTVLVRVLDVPVDLAVLPPLLLLAPAVSLPHRARAVRDGVLAILVLAAVVALVVLVFLVLAQLDDLSALDAGAEPERARTAVVAAVVSLLPLLAVGAVRRPVGSVGPADVVAAWVGSLARACRPRLVTAVSVAAVTVVLWYGLLQLPGASRAVAAVVSLLPVAALAVALVRSKRSTGRWRRGWWAPEVVVPGLALQVVAGLSLVTAMDDDLGAAGRLVGGHLVLAGLLTVLIAATATPGGPWRAAATSPRSDPWGEPGPRPVAAAVMVGGCLVAGGVGLLVAPAAVLANPLVDGSLAALFVPAAMAVALLWLPAWSLARTGVAAVGGLVVGVVLLAVTGSPALPADARSSPVGRLLDPADPVAVAGVLLGALVAVLAVASTVPRSGWVPLTDARARHVVLPGPLAVVAASGVLVVRPLVVAPWLDLSVLPAAAVLAVLLAYVAVLVRLPGASPSAVTAPLRPALRDGVAPALGGLLVTVVVIGLLPGLRGLPLLLDVLPWCGLGLTVLVTAVSLVRSAEPPPARVRSLLRDVVVPLSAAGSALLLLVVLRPVTGLTTELESLLVTAVALVTHVGRAARQRVLGTLDGRGQLRDLSALASSAALGVIGLLAVLGERPLWLAGLTWLLTGVAALALAAVVPGRLGGSRPEAGADRGWWAVRVGAAAALLGYGLAVVDLEGPVDRLTVPVGAVVLGFGVWALLERSTPPQRRPGTVRALGPGLAVALLPSTLPALLDPGGLRPVVLALVGVALVLAGAALRWRALLVAGLVVVVPVAVVQALPVVDAVPQWVYLAAAGVLALGVGVSFERQRERARAAGRAWRELR